MKTEVEYVVEGRSHASLPWLELSAYNEIAQARDVIESLQKMDDANCLNWQYRIVKRTTTFTDEVIE